MRKLNTTSEEGNLKHFRFRFCLRVLFTLTAVVALGCAYANWLGRINEWESVTKGIIEYLVVKQHDNPFPYRLAGLNAHGLGRWIEESRPASYRADFVQFYEVEMILFVGRSITIKFFTVDNEQPHQKFVFFELAGGLRKGDLAGFRTLLEPPTVIYDVSVGDSFYMDINGDGNVDFRSQAVGSCHTIDWEDRDGDGRFDLEYITMQSDHIWGENEIDIVVPKVQQ